MKKLSLLILLALAACKQNKTKDRASEDVLQKERISAVEIDMLLQDSVSIRAVEIIDGDVAFAGSGGYYGIYNASQGKIRSSRQQYDGTFPDFRSVASTANDFFMLSAGNPALLYKTGPAGEMELVYQESGEKVFYDSMIFWNNQEGIAMGDPTAGCISIVITRDGGNTWKKLPCDLIPAAVEGEAAFAASDSNIAVVGDETWIITGGMRSRVFYSPDKGRTRTVYNTPKVQGSRTLGAYSLDYFDRNTGFMIGGDYTAPEHNAANKAISHDGGKTWKVIADGQDPGYKSSVRYVPGSRAKELIAVGFTGISYSQDGGASWKELSGEGFYTIRFLNDSVAYAGGKNRLARLRFKRK